MEKSSLQPVRELEPSVKPFAELEKSLEGAGRIEELIRLYEARGRDLWGTEEAVQLLCRAGEAARERLGNAVRAEELYRRALLHQAGAREPLRGLRLVYEQKPDFPQLAEILERLANLTPGTHAAALYLKAADIHEQKCGRRDRAVLCCQLAIHADPKEREAYRRVRRILVADYRFQATFDSLERERAALGNGHAGEYLALVERLIDDPMEHSLAQRALERVFESEPQNSVALSLRKALENHSQTWRDRVRTLRTASLEERDRKNAARLSLLVAKLFAWYEPQAKTKVHESLDRSFLLWPAMPEGLQFMERMAAKLGTAEVIAWIEKLATDAKERASQAELWLKVGILKLTAQGEKDGALQAFEKAAEADPTRLEASSLAAELLLDRGESQKAVEFLEKYLPAIKDRRAQIALRLRLADLRLTQLKDRAGARAYLEAALSADPINAHAAFQLATLLLDEEDAEALDSILDLAISAPRPVNERVALCEAVAFLNEDKGKPRKAFTALAHALALAPTRVDILPRLRQAAEKSGAREELSSVLRRASACAPSSASADFGKALAEVADGNGAEAVSKDPQRTRSELKAEAKRLENGGTKPQEAIAVYKSLLELDPNDAATLKRLSVAYAAVGEWQASAQALRRQMDLAKGPDERDELELQLAQLYSERLGQKEAAGEHYLGLLRRGVDSPAVVAGLEKLAGAGFKPQEVAAALADHYGAAGDVQRQVTSLLMQLSATHDAALQKKLLAQLAATHEKQLLDPHAALSFWMRALSIDPTDEALRGEARRIATDLSATEEYVRALTELAGKVNNPALARSLWFEAADLAERAGSLDEAVRALDQAKAQWPDDADILTWLFELLVQLQRTAEADEVLRRRILVAAPEEKAALYLKLADLSAALERPREASHALEEAIAAGADEAPLLPKLAEYLERAGRVPELVSVLGRLIALAENSGDSAGAARVALKRAKVLDGSLGDRAEAIKHYAETIRQNPTDPEALTALEHLLSDERCREEAARALLPAYEAMQDHRKTVQALEIVIETTRDMLEQVSTLKQIAFLHANHLGQPDLAFGCLARAMRLDPVDVTLRRQARAAAESAEALDSYVDVLSDLTKELSGGRAIAVHRELAELYENVFDDLNKVLTHLQAILALEPHSVETLKILQRLYRANEDLPSLAVVLEKLAEATPDLADKASWWREAAQLYESRLKDKEAAAQRWRKIAELDPLNREAALALERLYSDLNLPRERAYALELRRSQDGEGAQGGELTFRLAEAKEQLGETQEALELYRSVLAVDPSNASTRTALENLVRSESPASWAAFEALEPALVKTGEHEVRIALREALLARVAGKEKARLAGEIRSIYERDLNQPDRAFMWAVRMFSEDVDRAGMQPELERLAQVTGLYDELAEIYETEAGTLFLSRAAEIREQLSQNDQALRLWKEILDRSPKDRKALDSLGRLYKAGQNAKSLSEVYSRKAQLAESPQERVALLFQAAQACEAAGDLPQAIEELREALAIERTSASLEYLARLLGNAQRFDEQIEALAQLEAIAATDEERLKAALSHGQLLQRLGRLPEAVPRFGRALELGAGEVALKALEVCAADQTAQETAIPVLEEVYRRAKDSQKLADILEVRAKAAASSELSALHEEIATLRESLGQTSLAFAARLQIFLLDPSAARAGELERLAKVTGSAEELAEVYRGVLNRGAPEPLAQDLWKRLAVVYVEQLSRFDLAAQAWTELSKREPQNEAILQSLADAQRKANDYKGLAQTLQQQTSLSSNVERQTLLLGQLAELAEEILSDDALATEAYRQIHARNPKDVRALRALDRKLTAAEQYSELQIILEREIELATGANENEALDLKLRLAKMQFGRLNDAPRGLALFEEVLNARPDHVSAINALETVVRSDHSLRGEAARILDAIFARAGEHLRRAEVLEIRATAEKDPQNRIELQRQIARLYGDSIGNPEMAFLAASRALKEGPNDSASLELCAQWVGPADAIEEFLELLRESVDKLDEPAARARLIRTYARLEGQPTEAATGWRKLLQLEPNDQEALEALAGLLSGRGGAEELIEVLRKQLEIAEDQGRKIQLLERIGQVQEKSLGDHIGALATQRRLVELKAEDPAILQRYEELCEQQERWPELAEVIAKRIRLLGQIPSESADESEVLELQCRLGLIRETKLMDSLGALELYREVLSHQPNHPGAQARVEAMVRREPQNQAAIDALLQSYRVTGDSSKLGELLEARIAASTDSSERKQLLLELAALRSEVQGQSELGFLALARAFKEDPNDAALRNKLDQIAEAAKSYEELAALLEEELPRVAEGADAARVCLRLGQLFEQKLGDPGKATAYYERARSLDSATWPQALPALDRLFSQSQNWAELSNVLEALSENIADPAEKVGLLFRLGQLAQDRLESPDRAAAAYEKILELDPKHVAACRLLEGIYERAGNAEKLAQILKIERQLASGKERDRVSAKLAQVSTDSFGDVEHSIEIYRELLAKNPRNEEVFAALEGLLEKSKRFDDLKGLLSSRLQHTLDPRELVRINERLGRVEYRNLGNAEAAIPFYKAALDRDARHKGALDALREIYESLERWDDVAGTLRRLIPVQEDASGVKAIRIRLGEVLAQLGRREEAVDTCRRALEIEPHVPEDLDRTKNVFLSLKAYGDAVRSLELRSEAQLRDEHRDQAIATLLEIVDLWRGPAGKPESSGAAIEKILELDPANRRAYETARELYSSINDWRAYAQVIDRYLPNHVTDEEKLVALRELASVHEQKLGQKGVAFLTACRALQLNPADATLRDEVERLAAETESYDELAGVYEEVADELPRGPIAERMYLVLARVQDEKLDDVSASEASLRKILEFDPTNQKALDTLSALFSKRGRHKEYAMALEQKFEAVSSIEERKAILQAIAQVHDHKLSDSHEASLALHRSLDLEPDPTTFNALVELYRRQKKWPEAVNALLRWRDLAAEPEERGRLQVLAAEIQERELENDEAAIAGYQQALEFDPVNSDALAALERLFTKLDRPAEMLSVYDRQMEITQDYRERVTLLFKSASIWEDKFANLANADACIESALSIDPQNIQAIKSLERLRRTQSRFEDLIAVLERHIGLVPSAEQTDLYVEMGEVFQQHLKQVDKAVTAFHRALDLNPKSRTALHALGVLYERSGNWPFALEMLSREAQLAGSTPEAVDLFHRTGKICEDMLMDTASAKDAYEHAIRIDAGYLPSIRALRGLLEAENDWAGYERLLILEAQKIEDTELKAKALLEVGKYFSEKKDDPASAAQWYEESLKHAPELVEAARPLADIYVAKEDWAAAQRMMDVVVRKMGERLAAAPNDAEAKELCRQHYRLGYIAEKLDQKDKALKQYERAYQLDSTYLPALEGLGNLEVQVKRYDDALKVYQTILIHHREELTDLEVVEIYWQLGDIHRTLEQFDRAQNHFEKALGIDPRHEPSLRSLITLADGAQRFDKAAEYRRSLIQVLEGDAKFQMCVELGALARDKLSDHHVAIDAFVQALKERPQALDVMDSVYVLYRETRQSQKAAEILERMLEQPELTKEIERCKRVYFALGEISRDELKDYDRAVRAFNAALDQDYRFVEAFSAIEALLGQLKQWKPLEENYVRMIQRLPKADDTHPARMTLWRAIGELYLRVLKQEDNALMAYKVVAAGLPQDANVQETFAELAKQHPAEYDKAVLAYQRAIVNTERPAKICSSYAEFAARRKDYDSAYLAAQVVAGLLGEAGPNETEIISKLGPYAKKRETHQKPITDRLWQTHLLHAKARGPLAELMALLFQYIGPQSAVPLSQYQLNPKKHRIDVGSAQEYQIHHFRYVAKALGMEWVELYSPFLAATRERLAKRSKEAPPDANLLLEVCHTQPPALRVGGKFFGDIGQKEVYYLLAKGMALVRPELALSQRLSGERLEAVVQAAISLSVPKYHVTADPKAIEAERKALSKVLNEPARAAMVRVAQEYAKIATPNDIRSYLEGVELSALRAGFFVAADFEAVKKMVSGEAGAAHRVPIASKIRELMVFALSEDLHSLRATVGTSVEVNVSRQ